MSIRTIFIQSLLALSLLALLVGQAQAQNTLLGCGAGASLTSGTENTLIGENAGNAITTARRNTMVGDEAGLAATTGNFNTMVGQDAGRATTTGFDNAFFGESAGQVTTTGSNNTYLGNLAGQLNQTGTGNVFVGRSAGSRELGSNKLYIANSSTSVPLIYGEFQTVIPNNALLGINGALGVGTRMPMDKLHVRDGNLRIEQTGASFAILNLTAGVNTWRITNNPNTGRLVLFSPGGGALTSPFKFDPQATENLFRVGVLGPSTVDVNGDLVVTGNINNPDYVFTPEYALESIEDHAAYMWQHRHLPAVGPGQVNAQGQGMVNVGVRSQGMLEELEKAHIYIEQLNRKMTQNDDQLERLQSEVTGLKEKEAQLKTLQGAVTELKALVHQLMGPKRRGDPEKEG